MPCLQESSPPAEGHSPVSGDLSIRLPKSPVGDGVIALLLFVSSCLYLRLFFDYSILNADEGITLQGAQRILQGQVLYRDFFSFVTPGSYYWMALLFRVLGSFILVGRAALMVYGGLFAALTYLLARRVCSRWSALLACFMVTLTCLPYRFMVLHNWDSTLLAYLSLYCAVQFVERNRPVWAFATGSLASLTFLFEQSKGAGLMLGITAGFALIAWLRRPRRFFDSAKIAALAAGLGWPLVVTFCYFAAQGSLTAMIDGWLWATYHYTVANSLPYGYLVMSSLERTDLFSGPWPTRIIAGIAMGPCLLLPILPIVAVAAFALAGIDTARCALARIAPAQDLADVPVQRREYFLLVSATLSGLLASALLTKRPDFTHLNYLGPLFYLVAAWLLDGWRPSSKLARWLRPLFAAWMLVSYTIFGMAILWPSLGARHRVSTARGVIRTSESNGALEYVLGHVPPGNKILVYPYQAMYYYLTGTESATRFDYLQPGMHSPQQFEEALRELELDRTRVVLFESTFAEKFALGWPNTPIEIVAARDPVAEFIFANYRPCAALSENNFWHFVFMVRTDSQCPSSIAGAK